MKIDLSFWRVVFFIHLAKSLLWHTDGNLFFFHLGTITDGKNTALNLIILPLSIKVGFATKKEPQHGNK